MASASLERVDAAGGMPCDAAMSIPPSIEGTTQWQRVTFPHHPDSPPKSLFRLPVPGGWLVTFKPIERSADFAPLVFVADTGTNGAQGWEP